MRSLSRREKMSQPRSPRWVCSMTVGMMKLRIGGRDGVEVAHGLGFLFRLLGVFAGFGSSRLASSGVTISDGRRLVRR